MHSGSTQKLHQLPVAACQPTTEVGRERIRACIAAAAQRSQKQVQACQHKCSSTRPRCAGPCARQRAKTPSRSRNWPTSSKTRKTASRARSGRTSDRLSRPPLRPAPCGPTFSEALELFFCFFGVSAAMLGLVPRARGGCSPMCTGLFSPREDGDDRAVPRARDRFGPGLQKCGCPSNKLSRQSSSAVYAGSVNSLM